MQEIATIVSGRKYKALPFVRRKRVSTSAEIEQQRIFHAHQEDFNVLLKLLYALRIAVLFPGKEMKQTMYIEFHMHAFR